MSTERPKVPPRLRPAPIAESHAQPKAPFPTATDLPPLGLAELNETVGQVVVAVNSLTVAVSQHDQLITDLLTRMTPIEQAQKTLPQKAAQVTGKAGMYLTLAVGGLGLLSQAAAMFNPKLVGPLQTFIQLLQSFGGP